jgi:hypothetical protein
MNFQTMSSAGLELIKFNAQLLAMTPLWRTPQRLYTWVPSTKTNANLPVAKSQPYKLRTSSDKMRTSTARTVSKGLRLDIQIKTTFKDRDLALQMPSLKALIPSSIIPETPKQPGLRASNLSTTLNDT